MRWYLNKEGQNIGPLEEPNVIQMIQSGEFREGWICKEGDQEWVALYSHPPFAQAVAAAQAASKPSAPPPEPAQQQQPGGLQPGAQQSGMIQPPAAQQPGMQPGAQQSGMIQPPGPQQQPGIQPGAQQSGMQPPAPQQSGMQPPGPQQQPGTQPQQQPGMQPPGVQQQPGMQPPGVQQQPGMEPPMPGGQPPAPGQQQPGFQTPQMSGQPVSSLLGPESFSIGDLIARIPNLFSNPKAFWESMSTVSGDVKTLLVPNVLFLAGIAAVTSFLGQLFGLFGRVFMLFIIGLLGSMILQVAASVGLWFLMAILIDVFADTFGAQKNGDQSRKLAFGALLPMWLSSLLSLVPLSIFRILGPLAGLGYGCYILYLGLPLMNNTPEEKRIAYTAVVMALTLVISIVLMSIAGCPLSCLLYSSIKG